MLEGYDVKVFHDPDDLSRFFADLEPDCDRVPEAAFAKGLIDMPTMARAGFWFNICALALITFVAYVLVPLALGAPD